LLVAHENAEPLPAEIGLASVNMRPRSFREGTWVSDMGYKIPNAKAQSPSDMVERALRWPPVLISEESRKLIERDKRERQDGRKR